ncbi:helix-turn-helix domain-containing protein [Lactobacillus hamsteri]|uniref:helix-turn-helix domain-containing protein n=1 Tax=Lactobacillus hamsteri TaxID=96565 RepID=UPI000469CAB5|nr:helix-turn-helix transcriptional regulator [Lactobacillus hamsteri]
MFNNKKSHIWDISTDNSNELVTIKRNSNIAVNFMLGEKFRKLRKAKGINIYKAAEGITSKSSLQRWENGQGEMSIEKVMALLKKSSCTTR